MMFGLEPLRKGSIALSVIHSRRTKGADQGTNRRASYFRI